MNINMRVCHFYVRLAELPTHCFEDVVVYVPVVAARRPEAQRIADGAVAVGAEAGKNRLFLHTLRMLRRAHKGSFYRLGRRVVACLHGKLNAPKLASGDVCDLGGGDVAVGKINQLVVRRGNLGVEDADLAHGAGFPPTSMKSPTLNGCVVRRTTALARLESES